MAEKTYSRKTIYATDGYTIRVNELGNLNTDHRKHSNESNIVNVSKSYYPLQWITMHKYVLVDMEKKLLGKDNCDSILIM